MKRPVSLLLLLIFAAIQIYFAKVPLSHQVQGSSWIEVTRTPGGLVERQGQYYLVAPDALYRLSGNGAHVQAHQESLNWLDVPEPSGAGYWKVALGPRALPLVGIGGPVYPSPDGSSVVWVDPATHLAYLSINGQEGLGVLSKRLGSVSQVTWAPDGQALGIIGQGPDGEGAYVWDRDGIMTPMALPTAHLRIIGLGFSQKNTLLAALSNGQVLWQGHGLLPLPPLQPVSLAKNRAAVLGLTANHVVFWRNGEKIEYARPDLKWVGNPKFAQNGEWAATLSRSMLGSWQLLTYGPGEHLDISLPFKNTPYHLLGFLGSHWILVTVIAGEHRGTYAWWVH